jgi:hypothetical protein
LGAAASKVDLRGVNNSNIVNPLLNCHYCDISAMLCMHIPGSVFASGISRRPAGWRIATGESLKQVFFITMTSELVQRRNFAIKSDFLSW